MSIFLRRLIVLCVVALASSAFAKTPADPGSIFSLPALRDQLREIDHLGGDGLLFPAEDRPPIAAHRAARDGMGLATRDEAACESHSASIRSVSTRWARRNQLHLFFDYGDNTTTLWSGDVAYTTDADNQPMAYTSTMAQCEQWSRGAWIDLLKKARLPRLTEQNRSCRDGSQKQRNSAGEFRSAQPVHRRPPGAHRDSRER